MNPATIHQIHHGRYWLTLQVHVFRYMFTSWNTSSSQVAPTHSSITATKLGTCSQLYICINPFYHPIWAVGIPLPRCQKTWTTLVPASWRLGAPGEGTVERWGWAKGYGWKLGIRWPKGNWEEISQKMEIGMSLANQKDSIGFAWKLSVNMWNKHSVKNEERRFWKTWEFLPTFNAWRSWGSKNICHVWKILCILEDSFNLVKGLQDTRRYSCGWSEFSQSKWPICGGIPPISHFSRLLDDLRDGVTSGHSVLGHDFQTLQAGNPMLAWHRLVVILRYCGDILHNPSKWLGRCQDFCLVKKLLLRIELADTG